MDHRRAVLIAFAASVLGCSAAPDPAPFAAASCSALDHSTDLASVMPPHLAIMFSMSWFGIPKTGDPLAAGPDGSWGNWRIPATCSGSGEPASCVAGERDVASKYRPLAGVYSSSGRDPDGKARIDLMLSNVRRSCSADVGARIDAFAIQLDGTEFSSLHSAQPSEGQEIPLQALKNFLGQADAAGVANVVIPADDATWYFNNGHWVGLDCAADHARCVQLLQQDTVDMLTLAAGSAASYKINGKPVLYYYVGSQLTPAEWAGIFAAVRATPILGVARDFYAVASHQGDHGSPYFAAFDGLSPWVDLAAWDGTSGTSVRAHALAYAAKTHADLYANVPAGRVVFGGIGPGFDDFTNGWSECIARSIPRPAEASPRDPAVLDGMIDFLQTKQAKGVVLQTWDDWTEGSFFEPSESEGTAKLEQLQTRLGELYGEAPVSTTDLHDRWTSYGQARSCSGRQAPPALRLCDHLPPPPPPPAVLDGGATTTPPGSPPPGPPGCSN
jgi:hypothetical protein